MEKLLFDLWWEMFCKGVDAQMRQKVLRAALLCGKSNRFFDCSGIYRIGHRRWNI
jgi:hypothetical protein